MFKRSLLLVFVLTITTNLFAQHKIDDSLRMEFSHAKNDTDKVNSLIHFCNELGEINPDSAILLGRQALYMSRRIAWEKGVIISQYTLGIYYEIKGDLNTALIYEDSALSLYNKYKYGSISSIYNELGNILSDQNNYTLGLDYYFKALAIDSTRSVAAIAEVCTNIGLDYQEMGEYLKSEMYYLKAQKIFEDENSKGGIASIFTNLGILYYLQGNYQKGLDNNFKAMKMDSNSNDPTKLIPDYQNIGLGYLYLRNYPSSLYYTFKALSLGKKLGETGNAQKAYSNIGQALLEAYQTDSAAKGFNYLIDHNKLHIQHSSILDSAFLYEHKSMQAANTVNDKVSFITALRDIGDIYVEKKDYNKAIPYYKQAYTVADSLGVLQQEMEFSEALGHTLAKVGNYEQSVKYLDNVILLKDTLLNKEKNKQMAELEAKYENVKKEKAIEVLSQKNEIQDLQIKQNRYLILGLACFALLVAGIGFLFVQQNRIKALHTKTELEQKLLRSQMNPHFIFNAMTSIQNFIYKEEPQKAANYLSSVFKLMRSILDGLKEEYVVLDKEIATLNYYLTLQQLCFQNKFDFTIAAAPDISVENTTIPPMIAQPFIENAIEHGIAHKDNGQGIITVRFRTKDEMLLLEIEDNGVGREKAAELNKNRSSEHLSIATNITKERIALLNRRSKSKISMNIEDMKDEKGNGTGTKVTFTFPLNTLI